jgi:hypothetical protein
MKEVSVDLPDGFHDFLFLQQEENNQKMSGWHGVILI